jgi:hypothetical protein
MTEIRLFRLFTRSSILALLNLPPPLAGRCEKIGICPLTLPSPARGEGELIEIKKKFPPP